MYRMMDGAVSHFAPHNTHFVCITYYLYTYITEMSIRLFVCLPRLEGEGGRGLPGWRYFSQATPGHPASMKLRYV